MYVFLERLAQDVFFEALNQLRDRVGVGPCFAAVVAWSESVGVVSLMDKGGFQRISLSPGLKQPCLVKI